MSCLGVLFAVDGKTVDKLKKVKREERPDYISDYLEEEWFEKKPDLTQELDKSWDAMHRMFCGGDLLYGNDHYPLCGVVLGGKVLYGDGDDEDDYIIILKTPDMVKDVAKAISEVTQDDCRRKYFSIGAEKYGFQLTEEDFKYTWDWLQNTIDFWKNAAEKELYVIFSIDQ